MCIVLSMSDLGPVEEYDIFWAFNALINVKKMRFWPSLGYAVELFHIVILEFGFDLG